MASARSTKVYYYAWHAIVIGLFIAVIVTVAYFVLPMFTAVSYGEETAAAKLAKIVEKPAPKPMLDVVDYRKRLLALAQVATSSPYYKAFLQGTTTATGTIPQWPVRRAALPNAGAILPFKRVVAYYGNFYSKGMGILGEYDKGTVLAKLKSEVAAWQAADPTTPLASSARTGAPHVRHRQDGHGQVDPA
jgi:hypothetical protein